VNLVYELLYLVGARPWERAGVTPELKGLVEGPGALTPGRALDILLFDSGCYHGLLDTQRATYEETIGRLAAPGASLLLFALTPGGAARPRTFRGASDEELRARFERDWEIVWKRPYAAPSVFGRAGQFWHLLRRRTHL
jgi:hypothetical protein